MKISKVAIARVFKDNPGLKEVHFTSDETPFIHINDARGYALKLKDKEVITVQREEDKDEEKKTAKEVIAEIEAISDLEAFNTYSLAEGENRATVLAAFEKKKTELNA